MVSARAEFLGGGHYIPLANALVELSIEHAATAGFVMESGAGTGYYIARVLDRLPKSVGLAIDLSKYAARRAAKAHDRLDAVVADVWEGLPLQSHCVDLAINVFAPRPPRELSRILRDGGKLIVAIPTYRHMRELREPLRLLDVDRDKEARVAHALNPFFTRLEHHFCRWTMELNHQQIASLVRMGPSARHIDSAALTDRMARLPARMSVTASMDIHVYARA